VSIIHMSCLQILTKTLLNYFFIACKAPKWLTHSGVGREDTDKGGGWLKELKLRWGRGEGKCEVCLQ